jgi:hypothetical protein
MNDVLYDSKSAQFNWPTIASEPVRALAAHWSILARDGHAPRRERFTPLDLPARGWKHLFLLDVDPASHEIRCRVHGTYLVEAAGRDFTGMRMIESEIPGCTRTALYPLVKRLIETGRPQYYKGPTLFRPPNWQRDVEQVLCPLTDAHGRLCAAIGAVEYAATHEFAETQQRSSA